MLHRSALEFYCKHFDVASSMFHETTEDHVWDILLGYIGQEERIEIEMIVAELLAKHGDNGLELRAIYIANGGDPDLFTPTQAIEFFRDTLELVPHARAVFASVAHDPAADNWAWAETPRPRLGRELGDACDDQ
jgi:hypothetical protein